MTGIIIVGVTGHGLRCAEMLTQSTANDAIFIEDVAYVQPLPYFPICEPFHDIYYPLIEQFAYIAPDFDFELPYTAPKNTSLSRRTTKAFHHFDIDYG